MVLCSSEQNTIAQSNSFSFSVQSPFQMIRKSERKPRHLKPNQDDCQDSDLSGSNPRPCASITASRASFCDLTMENQRRLCSLLRSLGVTEEISVDRFRKVAGEVTVAKVCNIWYGGGNQGPHNGPQTAASSRPAELPKAQPKQIKHNKVFNIRFST